MVCQSQGFAFAYLLFLAREAKGKTWKKTVFFVTSSFIRISWFSDSSFLLGSRFIRHTRYFFQNTEWKPFKTPNENLSKHRMETFQNTENAPRKNIVNTVLIGIFRFLLFSTNWAVGMTFRTWCDHAFLFVSADLAFPPTLFCLCQPTLRLV